MIFLNTSKTLRVSNFKIDQNVTFDGFYILTGNDVTAYFWSAANLINVSIFWVMFGSLFLDNVSIHSISRRFTVLEMAIQVLRFRFVTNWIFLPLDPENGAQMNQTSPTHKTNGCFRFSRKLVKLASSSQIYTMVVVHEGIYILAVNHVIRYFQSAANRHHATAAHTDLAVTK